MKRKVWLTLLLVVGACLCAGVFASSINQPGMPALSTPSILDTASPNAREVRKLFWLVMGFSIFVLSIVVAFMIAGIVGGIRDRNHDVEPPQTHGNLKLEMAWTIIPLIILAILLVPTLSAIYQLDGFAAPEDAIEVNVIGRQFWWEMDYRASGVSTANELVVPVGTAVRLNLASGDTMHSFWIPQLGGKRDLISNHTNYLWFTPDTSLRTTVFNGSCNEYCGASHANMRFRTFVVTQQEFDGWVQQQLSPAAFTLAPPAPPAPPPAAPPAGAPAP